jgi:hypothetical protein
LTPPRFNPCSRRRSAGSSNVKRRQLRGPAQPRPRPFQRGFSTTAEIDFDFDFGSGHRDRIAARYAADAGGAIGVTLRRRHDGRQVPGVDLDAAVVANEWLVPVLSLLGAKLERHYIPCAALLDVWVGSSSRTFRWSDDAPGGEKGDGMMSGWIQAGGTLEIPAAGDAVANIAWAWTRDLARHAGVSVYDS